MAATNESLPTRDDFDAFEGYLDEICAWNNFGGLNLSDAYVKFCESPDIYQEDFMFMGSVAFSYYFPVIERYIRETRVESEDDIEIEAIWILAHCIHQQFTDPCPVSTLSLRHRVEDLVTQVRNNLSVYCNGIIEQQRIDTAWQELQDRMTRLRELHE